MSQVAVTLDHFEYIPVYPEKAEPPWSGVIEEIQSALPVAKEVRQDIAIQLVNIRYAIIAHRIYKKRWCPRHKIPYPKRQIEVCEAEGDRFLALTNLAIELHAIGYGNQYQNALCWVAAIVEEDKQSLLAGLTQRNTKDAAIRFIRNSIRALRDGQNPVSEALPALFCLIEAALAVITANTAPRVFKPLWTGSQKYGTTKVYGLIPALEQEAAYLKDKSDVLFVESSRIVTSTPGRNRPKTVADFSLLIR